MTDSRLVTWFSRQMRLHQNRLMKRAGEAGKALRAGGGADFIFSASQRLSVSARRDGVWIVRRGVGVSAGCFVRW